MKRIAIVLPVCLFIFTGIHFAQTGFVVAGLSSSFNHGGKDDIDFMIYRLDVSGNILWQKNLGGKLHDWGFSIQQTTDGGYVVAGVTASYVHGTPGSDSDFLVYKLDANGDKQWRKNLGGISDDGAGSIQQTTDGGYVVAGYTYSYTHGSGDRDFLIYKLDATGGKQWRKNLGGSLDEWGRSVQQTADGGYVVAGTTWSYTHGTGDTDFIVYKLDATGAKQWRKYLGGTEDDNAASIQQTSDGGFVVAGDTQSYTHGFEDILVYKLDASGKKQWRKNYGGTDTDWALSVQQTADGGYVMAGASWSFTNGSADFIIYKLDAAGAKQWRRNHGGSSYDGARSIQQTLDGGYIVAGATYSYTSGTGDSDFLVYKLSSRGGWLWHKNLGGLLDDWAQSVQETN